METNTVNVQTVKSEGTVPNSNSIKDSLGSDSIFPATIDLRWHLLQKSKISIQSKYASALTYIISSFLSKGICSQDTGKYILARLQHYQAQLFSDVIKEPVNQKEATKCLRYLTVLWRRKYWLALLCDISLVIHEKSLVMEAYEIVKTIVNSKRQQDIGQMIRILYSDGIFEKKHLPSLPLIYQIQKNDKFFQQEERRLIITANMSAGKSTLINALIGKPVARTSQEVCTGGVCYLYNKPDEDEQIALETNTITLNASEEDLCKYEWDGHISMASYFKRTSGHVPRLCIIDTPGVDAALYKVHSERAHNALLNDMYNLVLYVVNPTRLGTDAEKKHLKWIAHNLQDKKIIFVLNKLDEYRDYSDSISESIDGLREDLLKAGFKNPLICPISAYFSYLIKLKMAGVTLSEDEEDEYAVYAKKFMRSSYDLSSYYDGVQCSPNDSEEIVLSKHAGLYGLEKIIYGEMNYEKDIY